MTTQPPPPDVTVYTGQNAPNTDQLPAPGAPAPFDTIRGRADFTPRPETHVQLWVGGVDVTCETLASMEISGGRRDKFSRPDASTVSLSIRWPSGQRLPIFGDVVRIAGWLPNRKADTVAALFYGTITDLAVEDDIVSLVATDPLARMSGVYVGAQPWPIEGWPERIEKVWARCRTKMHNPTWMRIPLIDPADFQFGLPGAVGRTLWGRDIDHQPAEDLLYHYLDPINAAIFYRPDTRWPSPLSGWTPRVVLRSGLDPHNGWTDPQCFIDSCFIGADPYPRLWQNMGVVINEWKVRYLGTPKHPDDPQPDKQAIATASAALTNRYGPRLSQADTELVDQFLGGAVTYAKDLADQLLAHTQVPTWSVDQVSAYLVSPLVDSRPVEAEKAWRIVAHGPGQFGRYINIGGVPSGSNNAWDPNPGGGWIVEETRITWDPAGWIVTIGCSNPSAYRGDVLDQTAVEAVHPPTSGPPAGVDLTVEVFRPYDHTAVTGGHLTVNGHGNYPVTAARTTVPSGPLTQGDNTITIAYVPTGTNAASQTTITIKGHP